MPDLSFRIEGATAVPFSETPLLHFKMRIANRSTEPVHSILLRCQVMIEARRRHYSGLEQEKLLELFGNAGQWNEALRSTLWTIATVLVPSFEETVTVDLPVFCTFDFNVFATKYFAGVQGGEVPLCFLFSGTVFYRGAQGALQAAQIPWDRQADYRLPVKIWKELIELYYPDTAWLCLRRDILERLQDFKARQAIPTWDQAIEELMKRGMEPRA